MTLPGLPATVQGGLFVTSPQYTQWPRVSADIRRTEPVHGGSFSHVTLSWPAGRWTGTDAGAARAGPASGPAAGDAEAGGTFTVTGSGDIAPVTDGPSGPGVTLAQTLAGVFVALFILAVIGAMFMTAEYRRGLIRVTLSACPRRGRVLAAKACVIGLVAFAAGLAGAAVAVPARAAGAAVPRRLPAAGDGADRGAGDRGHRRGACRLRRPRGRGRHPYRAARAWPGRSPRSPR